MLPLAALEHEEMQSEAYWDCSCSMNVDSNNVGEICVYSTVLYTKTLIQYQYITTARAGQVKKLTILLRTTTQQRQRMTMILRHLYFQCTTSRDQSSR